MGVPANGAADPLSLALANKLVGNDWDAAALEASLLGPTLRFDGECSFAVAGATVDLHLNGEPCALYETQLGRPGDELVMGASRAGARAYIAVAGGLIVKEVLGSLSTNLQAGFGGIEGRALQKGDTIECKSIAVKCLETPERWRPPMSPSWGLRSCAAAETDWLGDASRSALFDTNWVVDRRADRMGLRLDGPMLSVSSAGRMPSAGVIPGTIQCPEDGAPYILSVDAGTVGGYPRIAQVARLDRHVLGQLRPGDHVRLLLREPDEVRAELRAKIECWREWLPDIEAILC